MVGDEFHEKEIDFSGGPELPKRAIAAGGRTIVTKGGQPPMKTRLLEL